jgi:hypothetical protein
VKPSFPVRVFDLGAIPAPLLHDPELLCGNIFEKYACFVFGNLFVEFETATWLQGETCIFGSTAKTADSLCSRGMLLIVGVYHTRVSETSLQCGLRINSEENSDDANFLTVSEKFIVLVRCRLYKFQRNISVNIVIVELLLTLP